jgi:peptide/nickel transport system substrate-binding protein
VLTCLEPLNYPDKPGRAGQMLVPEAAETMPLVSSDGRKYTFMIRRGFRFNTGERVTARTFGHAIERILDPKMVSQYTALFEDIVGAKAFLAGKASSVSGISANGMTLSVRLVAPSPDFPSRVAMGAFCAVPVGYPVDASGPPASAGPYYIAAHEPGKAVEIKRNPFYSGSRPHHLDGFNISLLTDQSNSYLQIEAGQVDLDLTNVIRTAVPDLVKEFGVNKSRFFIHALDETDVYAFNMSRPEFANANLRKAVNYAVDRQALAAQTLMGGARPTDQALPPLIPGFRDLRIYPNTPNLAKARALAGPGDHGTAVLYFPGDNPTFSAQANILQADLAQIGIKAVMHPLPFNIYYSVIGKRDEPYDIAFAGLFPLYPDAEQVLNFGLDGHNITEQANNNFSQMNIPSINTQLENDAKLSGPARYSAFVNLDASIMRNIAPWVPFENRTFKQLISARVGCAFVQRIFQTIDLAGLCLK